MNPSHPRTPTRQTYAGHRHGRLVATCTKPHDLCNTEATRTANRVAEVIQSRRQGETTDSIAARLGITTEHVREILRADGRRQARLRAETEAWRSRMIRAKIRRQK